MLDFPAPRLLCYSRENAIAEKFEAMVKLGSLNSRMKDFYDIWLLILGGSLHQQPGLLRVGRHAPGVTAATDSG